MLRSSVSPGLRPPPLPALCSAPSSRLAVVVGARAEIQRKPPTVEKPGGLGEWRSEVKEEPGTGGAEIRGSKPASAGLDGLKSHSLWLRHVNERSHLPSPSGFGPRDGAMSVTSASRVMTMT